MPVLYNIATNPACNYVPTKPIYPDTNVLFWIFYDRLSLIPNPPGQRKKDVYADYFAYLITQGCTMRVMSSTLNELMHLVEKMEYEVYKRMNPAAGSIGFKEFRRRTVERNDVFARLSLICRLVEKATGSIDDAHLTYSSILSFVTDSCDHHLDFLDFFLASHCAQSDCAILTDDADFASRNPACDVFTANSRLIQDGQQLGFSLYTTN